MGISRFLMFFLGVFLFSSHSVLAETRIALVIGNGDYQSGSKLDNPVNDANLMTKTLRGAGFQVTRVVDADRFQMRKAMLDYSRQLTNSNTIGVFYYAGHGMQVDGQNYLLPIDASPARKDELSLHGVALSEFLRTLNLVSGSDGRLNVVILDACRNNPFARGWRSVNRGLATVDAPSGTLIAFATAPGDVAADGDGVNSPYTLALAQMIKKPGLAIEQTFKGARNLVWEWTKQSGKAQIPWESTSLRGDFYFTPGVAVSKTVREKASPKNKAVDDKNPLVEKKQAAIAKSIPKNKEIKKGGCISVGSTLDRAVPIIPGQLICSKDKKHKAIIKTIRKRAIVFSVNGEKNVVCSIKDLCQFNWPGAPLFGVNIEAVSKGKNHSYKYKGTLRAPR
jgi:hypothetical protein